MGLLLRMSVRAPWGRGGREGQGTPPLGIKPALRRVQRTALWSTRTVHKTTAEISIPESSMMCFLLLFSYNKTC